MHEEIFRELSRGATLITVNARLARLFAREFHSNQREEGRTVWRAPDVLPLDAFLNRCWTQCVWRGAAQGMTLLAPLQEQIVWEPAIRASPAGETLLRIPETARSAAATWSLIQSYRLPIDSRFEAAGDWAAFAGWSHDFERCSRANRWLEQARLSDFIAHRLIDGELQRPSPLYLAGFEEISPQQADLFAALGDPLQIAPARFDPETTFSRFEDSQSEIRAAAAWASALLEKEPDARIGIVVPCLPGLRTKVDRIFRDSGQDSFHVSLGAPLAQTPIINAAMLILEFGIAGLPLPSAGILLRSPFAGGFESEWTRRGLLDAQLRRKGIWNTTAALLREEASACPDLQRRLVRFDKLVGSLPGEQKPSEWCRDFARLLEAFGWPGDRTLSSVEYQVVQAWRDLLSSVSALDLNAPRVSYDAALSRLREIVTAKSFQVENEGAPIQIMGLLEASGLNFDHLWIMGLHNEALPFRAIPNPFLPIALQREYRLPHASADGEMDFARKLIGRLLASAPNVVLSYPAVEGDRTFSPSPLVSGDWRTPPSIKTATGEWVASMSAQAALEEFVDDVAPEVPDGSEQRGGASVFKDMAACPFRAFAKHRLFARPLEESMPGLSYRDRGNTVHHALQVIWSEIHSHARLLEMSAGELERVISRAVAEAVECIPHAIGRRLEQRRLEKLLHDWLNVEKRRDPFIVHAVEADRLVTIGGLQVKTRADRVDELASGRDIILDYKTGQLKPKAWDSERPDEPQLPLYCATSDRPIAGAAFAQIRVGELGFQGLAGSGAGLPGMKEMRMEERSSFQDQIGRWRDVLERLAGNFRAGRAEVDPRDDDACEHCGLWGLCRIRELTDAG